MFLNCNLIIATFTLRQNQTMKKLILLSALIIAGITANAQLCIPSANYNDSLPGIYTTNLPALVPGENYSATVIVKNPANMILDFSGFNISMIIKAVKITSAEAPAGFVIEPEYNSINDDWTNTLIVPDIYAGFAGCYTITADAASVNAAIANNGGSTNITINVYYDVLAKGVDGFPQDYTWLSTLNYNFLMPIDIGTGSSYTPWPGCVSNLFYNGTPTYYAGLPATSGSYQIDVQSFGPNCTWNVFNPYNWVTITPETGNTDATLTVTYTANTSGEERYANITIGTADYLITQITEDCQVAMTIDSSVIGPLEGTIYINVEAADTCYWSIINRSQFCDWVDINPLSGTGSGVIEVSYNANNGNEIRQCELNINGTTVTINQLTSISDETSSGTFQLYPNPANDVVNIALPQLNGIYTLSVYNTTGQLIEQQQLTAKTNQISTASLTNGMYILVMQNNKHDILKSKLIINR